MGDQRCTCSYTYGSTTVPGEQLPDDLRIMCARYLSDILGLQEDKWPNAINLNLYHNGSETIGRHADDESIFGNINDDRCIVSLSLGESRAFEFALRDPESDSANPRPSLQKVWRTDLHAGDICTMEGRLQRYYLHQVPMASGPPEMYGARANLTFRWIRNHRRHCVLRGA